MDELDSVSGMQSPAEVSWDEVLPLDVSAVFGREAPLEVDLGCGDGTFLAELAAAAPARDFIGLERLIGRVSSARRKIAQQGLSNAGVLRLEMRDGVGRLFPPQSVTAFHLMFPDPWPKRRHKTRRLIDAPFLKSLHEILRADGMIRIATDQQDYFNAIKKCALATRLFDLITPAPEPIGLSTFEKRYREIGASIYRVELRKISPVT
ncbi:MAG: tRNA (guanosine(46)-N7)-methyltransferase TrmB [Verrucomicrobiota bacterium]|nr:tRNA (guanosine(46)-N7)-methyltransferase TrmB [Verrucomicrobiota bacterium]